MINISSNVETLRKWPPVMFIDRVCVKPYTLEDGSGHSIQLIKDDAIYIPIIGIHRDPEYYPDPDRFDPERFSDERKHEIKPFTYFPFGSGPRNCIGAINCFYIYDFIDCLNVTHLFPKVLGSH